MSKINNIYSFIRTFLKKVIRNITPELNVEKKSLRYLLSKKAYEASADFIEENMLYAQAFETREGLYSYVMDKTSEEGLVMEFGVHNGNSINKIAEMTTRIVHGFDSFIGLPDDGVIPKSNDGGVKWYVGKMDSAGKLPSVNKNVELHQGWFSDTLPKFMKEHNEKISFMHIDSDIYSSAVCIFNGTHGRFISGTYIIFDEYLNYEGWQANEYRALVEASKEYDFKYKYVAYTYDGAVAITIL